MWFTKLAIELVARELRKLVVIRFLLAVGLSRRRHAHGLRHAFGRLVGRGVILLQHLAEGANAVTVAILLRQLAHLHFG